MMDFATKNYFRNGYIISRNFFEISQTNTAKVREKISQNFAKHVNLVA
jgi:hypothetical protein